MKFPVTILLVSIFCKTPCSRVFLYPAAGFCSNFPKTFGNHVDIIGLAGIACVLALAVPTGYHNAGVLAQTVIFSVFFYAMWVYE